VTAIEWTDATWNPVTGCSKVSPGCDHCYAETLSLRFGWSKKPWAHENAAENVVLRPERLEQTLRWRKPRMVFVNSMSDLFHENIPDEFIGRVFNVMDRAEQHTFQVLTKRPARARDFLREWYGHNLPDPALIEPPNANVWLGVSIESWRFNWRADVLREIPAAVRFISAEPLLDTLYPGTDRDLNLHGIDWVIVGGESGPNFRPMRAEWARELRDAVLAVSRCETCDGQGWTIESGTAWSYECCGRPTAGGECCENPELVPHEEPMQVQCRDCYHGDRVGPRGELQRPAFFFKQWGGRTPKAGGRELDGRTWDEYPE
jgi:protein gp37